MEPVGKAREGKGRESDELYILIKAELTASYPISYNVGNAVSRLYIIKAISMLVVQFFPDPG